MNELDKSNFEDYHYPEPQLGWVYVLKLENQKIYVGKSHNPKERIKKHLLGQGCEFTKTYKPIKIIGIVPITDNLDLENSLTLYYAFLYGIENVRGGNYAQKDLSENRLLKFKNELQQAYGES